MKMVMAVIKPFKLDELQRTVAELEAQLGGSASPRH